MLWWIQLHYLCCILFAVHHVFRTSDLTGGAPVEMQLSCTITMLQAWDVHLRRQRYLHCRSKDRKFQHTRQSNNLFQHSLSISFALDWTDKVSMAHSVKAAWLYLTCLMVEWCSVCSTCLSWKAYISFFCKHVTVTMSFSLRGSGLSGMRT